MENLEITPAQLLVTGDWTGITKEGIPEDFIAPAIFTFEYLPAGTPIPSGYQPFEDEGYVDLYEISEEAFGGDQNGCNVSPKNYVYLQEDNSQYAEDLRQGICRIFVSPSLSLEEIKEFLINECHEIWNISNDDDYYMVLSFDEDGFDPDYLKLAKEGKPFHRKIIFK